MKPKVLSHETPGAPILTNQAGAAYALLKWAIPQFGWEIVWDDPANYKIVFRNVAGTYARFHDPNNGRVVSWRVFLNMTDIDTGTGTLVDDASVNPATANTNYDADWVKSITNTGNPEQWYLVGDDKTIYYNLVGNWGFATCMGEYTSNFTSSFRTPICGGGRFVNNRSFNTKDAVGMSRRTGDGYFSTMNMTTNIHPHTGESRWLRFTTMPANSNVSAIPNYGEGPLLWQNPGANYLINPTPLVDLVPYSLFIPSNYARFDCIGKLRGVYKPIQDCTGKYTSGSIIDSFIIFRYNAHHGQGGADTVHCTIMISLEEWD